MNGRITIVALDFTVLAIIFPAASSDIVGISQSTILGILSSLVGLFLKYGVLTLPNAIIDNLKFVSYKSAWSDVENPKSAHLEGVYPVAPNDVIRNIVIKYLIIGGKKITNFEDFARTRSEGRNLDVQIK